MRLRVLISLNACVPSQLGTTPALRLNSGSARSMVSGAGGLESRVMVLGYRSGKGFAVWKDPAYVQRSSSRFATAPQSINSRRSANDRPSQAGLSLLPYVRLGTGD